MNMIDKKARRAELMETARKLQDQIQPSLNQLNYFNGAITTLNELITDEESEKENEPPETAV